MAKHKGIGEVIATASRGSFGFGDLTKLAANVSTINRQLEVPRRMLKLAMEWGKVERVLPKVEMLPGEKRRDRVLSADEETRYLGAAVAIGESTLKSYGRALEGIRATMRVRNRFDPKTRFCFGM